MITGSIATYFLGHNRDRPANPQVEWLRDELAGWESLRPDERRRLAAMLTGLAHDRGDDEIRLPHEEEAGPAQPEGATEISHDA